MRGRLIILLTEGPDVSQTAMDFVVPPDKTEEENRRVVEFHAGAAYEQCVERLKILQEARKAEITH